MRTLISNWTAFLFGLVIGIVLMLALLHPRPVKAATEPAKKEINVTAWTMVRGCPSPEVKHPWVLVVVLNDGSIRTFTDDTTPEMMENLKKVLGKMEGRVFAFPCGTNT